MIDQRIVFALDTREQGGTSDVPVPCVLSYDPNEPFQVSMRFRTTGDGVEWIFSREILIDALMQPTGDGDVRAWVNDDRFYMNFTSPEGTARVFGPLDEIESFVKNMLVMVPINGEVIDIDAELQAFLEG